MFFRHFFSMWRLKSISYHHFRHYPGTKITGSELLGPIEGPTKPRPVAVCWPGELSEPHRTGSDNALKVTMNDYPHGDLLF